MPNFSGIWNLKEQIQAIAAGRWTGIPEFELYAWGQSDGGLLGINISGNTNQISSPVQVGNEADWSFVASHTASSVVATKDNGTLWTWGENSLGQLGQNDAVARSSPTQVGALTIWGLGQGQIAGGNSACFALRQDGTMWAWGYGGRGGIGDNSIVYRSSPVQIGSGTSWTWVTGQAAITTTGELYSWGNGGSGRVGDGTTIDRSSPVQIGVLTNWAAVSRGNSETSGAIKTDGTLWMWGSNGFGSIGDGTIANQSSPVQIGALTNWSKLVVRDRPLAIKTDGTLWAWGRNDEGSLGDNTGNVSKSSPVQIGLLTDWVDIAASGTWALATRANGTLWSWGVNSQGQLGQNDTQPRSSPTQVGALTTWARPGNAGSTAFVFIQSQTN